MVQDNLLKASYVVREPRDIEELETLLRVRYQAFRESELASYVPENELGMDVDEWDEKSNHLGLWEKNGFEELAVGYLRIIGLNNTDTAGMVRSIGTKHPFLHLRIKQKTKGPIRFLCNYSKFQSVHEWFNKVEKEGLGLVEASRLSVLKQYQKKNLGQMLIETALAVFLNGDRAAYGAMEVMDHHLSFYHNYGFRDIARKKNLDAKRVNYLIVGHYSSLPECLEKRFATIRQSWDTDGFACF